MKIKIIGTILLLHLLMPCSLLAQTSGSGKVVQGKVTSATDGETLAGATVVETDSKKRVVSATITDINGHYVLKIKSTENKLVFSFIGFISQTVDISTNTTINMVLKEDVQEITEVVITAEKKYSDGTLSIPQREISTAVQTLDTRTLEGIQVTSIDDAIQGRIAGFDIVANSGDPGAGTTMRIRGATSINANSQPLIVVNNVPYEVEIDPTFDFASANQEQYANMLSINPDDIEEITVLKDAAATAVWGSKGANGVLMIKTKKGAMGKTRVQYTYRLTGALQPKGMNMLNGDDYTMMIKQAYFNPEQNEYAANVREFLYDKSWSEYENFNNNTDWVKEVTQVGIKHDHYLTVSGGGERAMFRVSGGYLTQTGTVIGQQLDRISSRAVLDYSVSDRIKFITELSYTYTDNDRNWRAEKDNDRNKPDELSILTIAYRKMPNVSVYQQDLDGNNTDAYYNIPRSSELHSDQRDLRNPVALALLAKDNLKNYRILPTFRLQYDMLDPEVQILRYSSYVSFDVNNDKVSKFLPGEVSNALWNESYVNRANSWDSESMTVMADNNITWIPKFSNIDHDLMLYGSFQIRTGNSSSMGIETTNLPSGEIVDASSEGYLSGISSSRFAYRSNAFLARGHYGYKGRYFMGFTFRRDGSTKFGNDNKYGNFPGLSFKWIISDEPFMQFTRNWLSMLAIRPSWGISGNQPRDEYLHFSRYAPYGSYIDIPATRPTTLRLSNLKWETTTSLNYGIDLGFFNDRIMMDVNFYNKRTEDLLFEDLSIPSSSGYGSVSVQNVGIMDNNGWEVNFYTNNIIKVSDFTMDFNFNLSNYLNTIVDLRDDVLASYNADFDYTNGNYLTYIQEGNSFGSIYGFKYKGVYQYNEYIPGIHENAPVARDENGNVFTDEDGNPLPMYFAYDKSNEYQYQGGDAIYEDINHDGNIDELDIVYLGNANPKVNGGFGSIIRYKGFGCTVFFNFRYGNKVVNAARMYAENMYTLNNQSKSVNWRWRKDGDVTDMPRALYNYGYNWLGSDRYVEDGSFLRFKYLTFNYSLPKEKLAKLSLQQLNFYLTINNLYVWTRYTGVDPEIGYDRRGLSMDYSSTPRSKDCTLGISITF
ncbi:MAG: SusC/RagA family TonB-linked outer membrane protein [Bacteroidales bacterium]|nr:SusC/RagA family TonB-linked outer membrane protein [Bacteroidales bacterium]